MKNLNKIENLNNMSLNDWKKITSEPDSLEYGQGVLVKKDNTISFARVLVTPVVDGTNKKIFIGEGDKPLKFIPDEFHLLSNKQEREFFWGY